MALDPIVLNALPHSNVKGETELSELQLRGALVVVMVRLTKVSLCLVSLL